MDGRAVNDSQRPEVEGRRGRGRPPQGAALVNTVSSGSPIARKRLEMILRTISGELTIEEACGELGVKRSRFHDLRSEFLERATGLLEPRPPGPQRRTPTAGDREAEQLRRRIADLELELDTAQIREEIAIAMPYLLKPDDSVTSDAKKNRRSKRANGTRPKRRR